MGSENWPVVGDVVSRISEEILRYILIQLIIKCLFVTRHAHKSTVMDLKWNENGNWLITASRDHLLKLFDLRNLSQEVQTFRGHKKEASSVAWHPVHEGLFCSGGSDGAIMFWHVG